MLRTTATTATPHDHDCTRELPEEDAEHDIAEGVSNVPGVGWAINPRGGDDSDGTRVRRRACYGGSNLLTPSKTFVPPDDEAVLEENGRRRLAYDRGLGAGSGSMATTFYLKKYTSKSDFEHSASRGMKRFDNESRIASADVTCIVIDEVSFIDAHLLGRSCHAIALLANVEHLYTGGVPIILAGDCHQKDPHNMSNP